jgi:plastocyanin
MKIKYILFLGCLLTSVLLSCTKKGSENYNAGGNIPSRIISILPGKLNPSSISYYKGTNVTFTNLTDQSHKLLSPDSTINSGVIEKGKSYTLQFLNVGTYDYQCTLHNEQGSIQIVNQ